MEEKNVELQKEENVLGLHQKENIIAKN